MASTFNFATTPAATPSTNIQWNAIQNAAGQNSLINQLYAGKPAAPTTSITSSPNVTAASSAVKSPSAPAPQTTFGNPIANQGGSALANTISSSLTNNTPTFNPASVVANQGMFSTTPVPQPVQQSAPASIVQNNNLAAQYPSLVGSAAAGVTPPAPSQQNTATIQPVQQTNSSVPAQVYATYGQENVGTSQPQNSNGLTTEYDANGNPIQVGDPSLNPQFSATNPTQTNQNPQVPQAGQPATIDPSLYGSGLFGSLLQNAVTAQQTSQEFDQNLQQGENNVTKQAIPLEDVQGQQAAMQRDYGIQQTALSQQAQNAIQAAQLAEPVSQYGALTSPATGQAISGGASGGTLPASAQSFITSLATQVQNGQMTRDQATSQLSAYGPAGLSAFNSALGPNFNTVQSNANAASTATNLSNTSSQAQATQQSVSYANQVLDDLTTAYNAQGSLQKTGIPLVNAGANLLSQLSGFGISATQGYSSTQGEALAAISQALASGGITPSSAGQIASSLIPPNATPDQIATAKQYLQTFLSQRQQTYTTPPQSAQYGSQPLPANTNTAGGSIYDY